jgi:hypothetical protein
MTATTFVAVARQHDQVSDNDPPPHPPRKAFQSVIRTPRQLDGAAHHTNAPFNAVAEPLAVLEPRLLFVRLALRSFGTGVRNGCVPTNSTNWSLI